jgi:3-keto-disaccharide hydrolase
MHRLSFILPRRAVICAALLLMGAAMAAEPNTLTPQEQAAGWRLMFDGRSTAGWHTYGKKPVTAGSWKIQDGCLVLPKGNGRPNGTGGDLVTNALFTNFEFQFEWRVGPGGNSGVEYLFTEGEKRTASFYAGDKGDSPMGFEYQVLDDAPHAKNAADRLAASIYSLVAATGKTLRPVGEFNQGRIVVNGNHVEHWLNGTKVAECELGSATFERIIAGSKYKPFSGVGIKRATSIALQDHGAEVAYRNLKLRELRPSTSSVPVAAPKPSPAAITPPKVASTAAIQASDWCVWCWSKADKRWVEHPLDKMTVQIQGGVLTARNTTNSNWPRAILLYRRAILDGDFTVSADYRGQIESFDLQSADTPDQRLTCLKAPQDNQWRPLLLSRKQGQYTAKAGAAAVPLQTDKAPAGMKGYFCFKLRPNEAVEIKNVRVELGR